MTKAESELMIKKLADKEFITKLVTIAKIYGWSGDFYEIFNFIQYIQNVTEDTTVIDFIPFDIESE